MDKKFSSIVIKYFEIFYPSQLFFRYLLNSIIEGMNLYPSLVNLGTKSKGNNLPSTISIFLLNFDSFILVH